MVQTEKKTTVNTRIHEEYKESNIKWYSEDELNNEIISAYQNFEKSLKDGMKEKFDKNINTSKEISEKIFIALNKAKGISCKKIHLRATSLISFDAIIVISEKAYLSERFEEAFKIAFEHSKSYQKDSFTFDFSFMPYARIENTHALVADGYYYSLEPLKSNESKT